jgi:hypothetical protein
MEVDGVRTGSKTGSVGWQQPIQVRQYSDPAASPASLTCSFIVFENLKADQEAVGICLHTLDDINTCPIGFWFILD